MPLEEPNSTYWNVLVVFLGGMGPIGCVPSTLHHCPKIGDCACFIVLQPTQTGHLTQKK
jgi:hypothetical protein